MKRTEASSKPVALITGSRRGIGLGIAEALARNGFDTVLNGTAPVESARKALETASAAGNGVVYVQADISKNEARRYLVDETRARFGRLDVLVNNAGVAPLEREDILDAAEESFDRVIDINLKGPYFLTQRVAKWMIEQKKNHPDATPKIINISSISAYTASCLRGEYCVSKAGVSMMTALFAARLAEFGIGVYELRPGIISTDMTAGVKDRYDDMIRNGLTPIRRWGNPEDIGRAAVAVALDYLPFSTGEVINVDGGFHLRTI